MTAAISAETRAALHEALDSLLQERERIEVRVPGAPTLASLVFNPENQESSAVTDHDSAARLFRSCLALVCQIIGPAVHDAALPRAFKSDGQQRQVLRDWLLTIYPLFDLPPKSFLASGPERYLSCWDVFEALSALDAGETRPIFVANTGKAKRANRYSLARRKVEALFWKKRLRALGHTEKGANFEITTAFGEQWDTIRKWRLHCEQILGETYVQWGLNHAGSDRDIYIPKPNGGMFGAKALDPGFGLKHAGEEYRAEVRRTAELSKRKSRNSEK